MRLSSSLFKLHPFPAYFTCKYSTNSSLGSLSHTFLQENPPFRLISMTRSSTCGSGEEVAQECRHHNPSFEKLSQHEESLSTELVVQQYQEMECVGYPRGLHIEEDELDGFHMDTNLLEKLSFKARLALACKRYGAWSATVLRDGMYGLPNRPAIEEDELDGFQMDTNLLEKLPLQVRLALECKRWDAIILSLCDYSRPSKRGIITLSLTHYLVRTLVGCLRLGKG